MSAIAHMVMWKLNGATAQVRHAQAQDLAQGFEAMRGKVAGLLHLEVGANRIDTTDACDLALYMVFESRRALEAYNAHPEHLKIKARMTPLRMAKSQADFELASY